MLLSKLLERFGVHQEFRDTEVTYITDNTKKIKKGCVFVCIRGAHFDGHTAALAAAEQGAAAVIAEPIRSLYRTRERRTAFSARRSTIIRQRS